MSVELGVDTLTHARVENLLRLLDKLGVPPPKRRPVEAWFAYKRRLARVLAAAIVEDRERAEVSGAGPSKSG